VGIVTTLQDVITDWKAECDALDRVLEGLQGDDWHKPTPAEGWDTRDTVGHLSDTNDVMHSSVTGGPRDLMAEAVAAAGGRDDLTSETTVDAFTAWQMEKVRRMSGPQAHAWWRETTARLLVLLDTLDPGGRYRWGPNMVSPMSLGSARMMETWAHSLDIHGAHGVGFEHSDRVRHVAFLGWRAIPYAFGLVGLEAPGPFRLELVAPSGAELEYGPADAQNVIRGAAVDWAFVVARRDRDGAAQRLQADGPDAAKAIEHGRAFL
jgi:uncharacterized protein (TIGR03084 family)